MNVRTAFKFTKHINKYQRCFCIRNVKENLGASFDLMVTYNLTISIQAHNNGLWFALVHFFLC